MDLPKWPGAGELRPANRHGARPQEPSLHLQVGGHDIPESSGCRNDTSGRILSHCPEAFSQSMEPAMSIGNMNDLFLHQLKDIYFAENQILKALPKMSEKATSPDLADAFDEHLEETRTHVDRL